MTLYLKYRPQRIKDLDLARVRQGLENMVQAKSLPHALLFSGPRGTGKTSAARILAKVVNCEGNKKKLGEPCNRCGHCKTITKGQSLDVIELDAASHRGIDDVRALRGAVKLSPAKARKKVYIIDEAHMLTTEASNALLKTLEEPPDHVMFILATTNPEKLIPTIRSRTTNINFSKAKKDELTRSLAKIARGEKLKIDKKTLELIADSSDGSFRDAAKILEQIVAEKVGLKYEKVAEYLTRRAPSSFDQILGYLAVKDLEKALREIEKTVASGASVQEYTRGLTERIRLALLAKVGLGEEDLEGFSQEDLISLSKILLQVTKDIPGSYLEQLPLEIAVIEWCHQGRETISDRVETNPNGEIKEKNPKNRKNEEKAKKEITEPLKEKVKTSKKAVKGLITAVEEAKASAGDQLQEALGSITEGTWKQILAEIRPINTSVEALLRATKPMNFDGRTLTLGVFYQFHKDRLEEIRYRKILEEVIAKVINTPAKVVCTLTNPPLSSKSKKQEKEVVLTESGDKDIINMAKDIFSS